MEWRKDTTAKDYRHKAQRIASPGLLINNSFLKN